LMPFYQTNGDFHTGETVADIRTFGYTYPEINFGSMTPEQTKQTVIAKVNQLYGNGGPGSRKRTHARKWSRGASAWKEYYVQIRVERSELEELPCTINVMLGDELAGSMAVLSMPTSGHTFSEVQLNRALEKLSCLDPEIVRPFLEQEFHIEIRKVRGFVQSGFSLEGKKEERW
jgi:hypothetical protein